MFFRQPAAEPQARLVNVLSEDHAVGPGEIDVFENALTELAGHRLAERAATDALRVDDHQLAGQNVALERRADLVQGAGLAREHVAVAEPADRERAESVAVARRHDGILRHQQERERALQFAQRAFHAAGPRAVHRVGDQVHKDFAVRAGLENRAGLLVRPAHSLPRWSGSRCGREPRCRRGTRTRSAERSAGATSPSWSSAHGRCRDGPAASREVAR